MSRLSKHRPLRLFSCVVATVLTTSFTDARAADLHIGGATVSITPDQPVALSGQMRTRISQKVASPVTATALAVESRDGDKTLDQAVMISCDLVAIEPEVLNGVRDRIQGKLDGLDPHKIFISATHTHTAPVIRQDTYKIPQDGVLQPAEYVDFLIERLVEAVTKAWETREPGRVGWGLGHAVVAQNRRSVYADGRAVMYGATNLPDFREIEGPEDQGVEVLFFWNAEGTLIATAVNVACPSQEVEGTSNIDADFWHPVRETLRAKYGENLHVLGWTGAAGDQSPHLMYRKQAEERMRELRGLTRLEEIARRIVTGWEDAYEGARQEQHADVPLIHRVENMELPVRPVTDAEFAETKEAIKEFSKDPNNHTWIWWHQLVVDRYERQQAGTVEPFTIEVHVLRLGDVAITTNVFELFTQYGIQMKARSRALQTFVIQLAGPGSYLPTDCAVRGGGYSAIAPSNLVGPEGGQVLVDLTVEAVNNFWPTE